MKPRADLSGGKQPELSFATSRNIFTQSPSFCLFAGGASSFQRADPTESVGPTHIDLDLSHSESFRNSSDVAFETWIRFPLVVAVRGEVGCYRQKGSQLRSQMVQPRHMIKQELALIRILIPAVFSQRLDV